MREILFRAKDIETKEWLVGYYSRIAYCDGEGFNSYIKRDGYAPFKVDADTVGQYTGLKDKDGVQIFEGDILKDIVDGTIHTVFSVDGGFVIESNPTYFGYGEQGGANPTEELSNMQTRQYVEDNHIVIGNIYDNKELLK